jgi:hypothetical protein
MQIEIMSKPVTMSYGDAIPQPSMCHVNAF